MVELSAKKPTKFVRLTFFLKTGHAISGEFHVPAATGSSVRPSDMLNEVGPLIGLTNVNVVRNDGTKRRVEFIRLAMDAVAWVEFPPVTESWHKGSDAKHLGHKALAPGYIKEQ